MNHPSTPIVAQTHAAKPAVALSYIPCILFKLDNDTREMFAEVLQAMRDGGYEDGLRDGEARRKHNDLKEHYTESDEKFWAVNGQKEVNQHDSSST